MTASRKQERGLAKKIGGRPTPASGAFWSMKGDVRNRHLLVEAKTTEKKSYSITLDVWEKIRREAILDGRIPVLAVQIQGRNLIVLDEEDFLAYYAARHLEEGELP